MTQSEPAGDSQIENRTYAEIQVGDSAALVRTLSQWDIELFAVMSGDVNPTHLDPDFAAQSLFHKVVAHGMWGGALISTVLGTQLPGPGTIYLAQDLRFLRPVTLGDTLEVRVTVCEKHDDKQTVLLDCLCTNQHGETVISGHARVKAPSEKIKWRRAVLPEVRIFEHRRYQELLKGVKDLPAVRTAIVHPCDTAALAGALEAAQAGLIVPVLVGPRARIEALALSEGLDITGIEIVDAPHSHASAAAAVALGRAGQVGALMKGSLHTDELIHAVLDRSTGLRTERRLSHVFLFDVPAYPRPLMITDAAINIQPSLDDKRDICQNAIDLARVIGIRQPKVAILSAVETVNPAIPSTLDAAALCKMAERGQISGGIVDGPLAFDNAVSLEAARTKGIVSPVAGQADILLVPDLEAGNMLAKQLTFFDGADAAGIVLGAQLPIILTSRADSAKTRIASCAAAVLMAYANSGRREKQA
ncbi:bifunctional enoyl-CoA hydratase/phosphate acetyltransferase [Chitinimonas sp.]|uniref:bifunctional enoyl-CoA hydratase/phosphate acetyltransferase n=1 Tax=Chitinimonas sp. TaxID=1934313 RepID=UPI0035B49CE4